MRSILLGILTVALILVAHQGRGQAISHPNSDDYEDRNFIDYGPIKLSQVSGVARDPLGLPVVNLRLLLFTERKHVLLFKSQTDDNGTFKFSKVPNGRYRLVAKTLGFCTANVPIIVQVGRGYPRKLLLHMTLGHLDSCSYGDVD